MFTVISLRPNKRSSTLNMDDEGGVKASNNNTSKKTTRKTAVKELEDVDEKPLTPSRRSARIRSNTSIVSETTQTFDSPRAKRAARRTSQVVEIPPAKPITGTIVEEEKFQECPIKSNEQNHSPSGFRKSLCLKKNKNSTKTNLNDTSEHIDTNGLEDNNTSNKENETNLKEPAIFKEKIITSNISNVVKNNLSESNSELLQNLKTEPVKKTLTLLFKRTSAVTDKLEFKTKRHRTKSWTSLSPPVLNDNVIYFSDSETVKNKRKSTLNSSNTIVLEKSSNTQKKNSSLKKIKKSLQNDFANDSKLDSLNTSNKIENDKILTHSNASTNIDAVTSVFEKEPSATTIFIEETDSNSEKNTENIKHADEDHCVPVVEPHYKEESQNNVHVNFIYSKDKDDKIISGNQNDSCEPMDIDETIPDSISHSKAETSSNKETISKEHVTECSISKGGNKRDSSITSHHFKSQIPEKSSNENKSTLVLSQLKDISNDNNVPPPSQTFTEKIANSERGLDTTQDDNSLERKNSLTAYSTSTPLHQKGLMKLVMNINTSDVTSDNTSKIEKNDNEVNKNKTSNVSNKSCNQSVSDEESERKVKEEGERKLIDDEAEEIEMTIYDENSNNELDPLSIGIKKELVTPQISTTNISINFVDPANSIENEDNNNKSLTNKTHIDDPLDDSNTSTSDSSDNIHIQNYDSVLNELNNSAKNKKKKSADISLNLHKKTKQKTMPIIDELNLTQLKTKKQIQNKDEVDAKRSNKSKNLFSKNKPNNEDNDNESSDSINFHLFFSEDSNGSENLQNKKKNNEVESSILLKQSPGKTNFLEISGSKCINASSKKKKELKKTLGKTVFENEKGGTDKDVEIRFIMDKTGTHSSTEIKKSFDVNTKENKIKQFVKHDVQKEQGRKNTKDKSVPHNQVNFERAATGTDKSMTMKKEIKKRKQREDDEGGRSAKVQRITSPENAIVPRLPPSILNKLQDKPKKKNLSVTKSKVISTSNFMVEEAKTVKNKPSNYLEESIYLNEDELLESKKQNRIKNPKVLPLLPTVSTSISGYTTDFKVNVIPKEFKFIAKSSNISNFKNDYLENKKIKRLGTYGLYKKNRNVKLSKF